MVLVPRLIHGNQGQVGVMDDAAVAGHDLDALNPGIVRENVRQDHIAIGDVSGGRQLFLFLTG